jgi:hypothetical protein
MAAQTSHTHYHLRLYHMSSCLQAVEQAQEQQAARHRARELTDYVQDLMRARTYRVRAEPCTLIHFPQPRHTARGSS